MNSVNGKRARILLVGVGGQGTLTATRLLAQAALDLGIEAVAGEVHGMAQRGGVVESAVLMGGYRSPRLGPGEADLLLGFEPLETLRALRGLRAGGAVISSSETILPPGVAQGKEEYPTMEGIRAATSGVAGVMRFLPIASLGKDAGSPQSANIALLGAACAMGLLPVGLDDLKKSLSVHLKAALRDVNLRAANLGAEAATRA